MAGYIPRNPYNTEEDDLLDELALRADAQEGNVLEELLLSAAGPGAPQRAPAMPDYNLSAQAERPDLDGGKRPDFLGHEDEGIFETEERVRKAGELYQKLPPAQPQAQAAQGQWENEFLQNHQRPDDKTMREEWLMRSLLHGEDNAFKARDILAREQQGFDQGLNRARSLDMKAHEEELGRAPGQRVSRALAEAIASTGLVTPEAAVELNETDPVVKAFSSGMYSQGLRQRGQDVGREKNKENNLTKLQTTNQNIDSREKIAAGNNQTALDVADKRAAAAKKPAGGGGGVDLDLMHKILVAKAGGVDLARAEALIAGGDASDLPPDKQQAVQIAVAGGKQALKNEKVRTELQKSIYRQDALETDKQQSTVATSVAKKQTDPALRDKRKTQLTETALAVKNAAVAWQGMSPQGKKLFATVAQKGAAGDIRQSAMSPDDQARAGAVMQLLNELVKERSGSAVTDSEMERVAAEIGLPSGKWSPFNSEKNIERYINAAREKLMQRRKVFEEEMGGW